MADKEEDQLIDFGPTDLGPWTNLREEGGACPELAKGVKVSRRGIFDLVAPPFTEGEKRPFVS